MRPETKILLVEDERLVRLRLRSLLDQLGFHLVTEAADGEEALAACEREPPNFILTDLCMPEMDGFRLLAWMKARFPEIPVIVISAVDTLQDAVEAFRHGAWDYLTKPIEDTGTFEVVIKRALGHADLLNMNRQYQEHLETLVSDRTRDLKELNKDLEHRVAARTTELVMANKELDAFSYSVSHDLMAPLRRIEGFSRSLLEDHAGSLSEEALRSLIRIQANTNSMGHLIDDLLALSRVSRAALHHRKMDLSGLAREILNNLREKDPIRSVAINVQNDMEVWADPGLLRIVLVNLLGNAWKYTSKTEHATLAFNLVHEHDGSMAFCIQDNGAGFDMAYVDKLFNAFQRLHSAEEFEGTGIGLAIVQRVIHRHGGRVWAEAETGKGATFFFTLPERGDAA